MSSTLESVVEQLTVFPSDGSWASQEAPVSRPKSHRGRGWRTALSGRVNAYAENRIGGATSGAGLSRHASDAEQYVHWTSVLYPAELFADGESKVRCFDVR